MSNSCISDFIKKDLSEISMNDLYSIKSLTVVDGSSWRHYELGPVVGFILWNVNNYHQQGQDWIGMAQISEDDMYWYAPDEALFLHAAWINQVLETLSRLKKWYDEYIFQGWEEAIPQAAECGGPMHWVVRYKKEIKPEKVNS